MISTIAHLTAAGMLRKWRGFLLALLPLAALAIVGLIRGLAGVDDTRTSDVLTDLLLGTVVPLTALIVGTGAISTEIDDGSIVYLMTKPIPRWKIVATKLAVAIAMSLAFAAAPTLLAGVMLSAELGDTAIAFAVAAAIGCVVYCSVFVLIGAITRYAVLAGLGYILLWEGLVAGLLEGARTLSITSWSLSISSGIAPDGVVPSDVGAITAVVLATIAVAASGYYAARRLRSLTMSSGEA